MERGFAASPRKAIYVATDAPPQLDNLLVPSDSKIYAKVTSRREYNTSKTEVCKTDGLIRYESNLVCATKVLS